MDRWVSNQVFVSLNPEPFSQFQEPSSVGRASAVPPSSFFGLSPSRRCNLHVS